MVSGLSTRMTTQRFARASRSRFFIGLGILILTVGFVAIFHNSQQELDQLRQMELRCEQQQQTLTKELASFELAIKSERHEHQQTKIELMRSTNDVKEFRDKHFMETNMKFGALQQSYKLLKSQNDDLVDECGKLRTSHLEQLSSLESKLKNIDAQHSQILRQKDREAADLRAKVKQLEDKADHLQQRLSTANANSIQSQLDAYRAHCAWRPLSDSDSVPAAAVAALLISDEQQQQQQKQPAPAVVHNFNAQHPVSANLYAITMESTSQPARNTGATGADGASAAAAAAAAVAATMTMALGPVDEAAAAPVRSGSALIINSVENFQIVPKPLPDNGAAPPPQLLSSTSATAHLSSRDGERIGASATIRTTSTASSAAAVSKPKRSRQIPEGVVPIPENDPALGVVSDATAAVAVEKPVTTAAAASQENNRYANVMDGIDGETAGRPLSALDGAAPDADNGAHEVMDGNDFLVDGHSMGHKDHMQLVLEDKQLVVGNLPAGADGNNNNAAEDEANDAAMENGGIGGGAGRPEKEETEEDNAILSGIVGGGGGGVVERSAGQRKMRSDQKLLSEIDADLGKVAGYQEDVQLEDDGDDDEYGNPAARNMDPAVRN